MVTAEGSEGEVRKKEIETGKRYLDVRDAFLPPEIVGCLKDNPGDFLYFSLKKNTMNHTIPVPHHELILSLSSLCMHCLIYLIPLCCMPQLLSKHISGPHRYSG